MQMYYIYHKATKYESKYYTFWEISELFTPIKKQ